MQMNNRIVCIEWVDSAEYEDADWKTEQEVKDLKPMLIKSAGILVNEDDIYQSMLDINDSGSKITITKLASVLGCSQRTIHRNMGNELKKEKELLNQQLWQKNLTNGWQV